MILEIVGHFFLYFGAKTYLNENKRKKIYFYYYFTGIQPDQMVLKYKLFLLKMLFPVSCVLLYQIHYFQTLWDTMMPNKYLIKMKNTKLYYLLSNFQLGFYYTIDIKRK